MSEQAGLDTQRPVLRIGVRFPRWLWWLIGFSVMETWVEWHGEKLSPVAARLTSGGVGTGIECDYEIPGAGLAPGVYRTGDTITVTNG